MTKREALKYINNHSKYFTQKTEEWDNHRCEWYKDSTTHHVIDVYDVEELIEKIYTKKK